MGKIADAFKGTLTKRFSPVALIHEHKDKVISAARDEAHQFAYGFVKKQLLVTNAVVATIFFIAGCAISSIFWLMIR